GIGFKNRDTNAALTVPAAEVKKVAWFKGVRGPTVRIANAKGDIMDFEALPKDSFDELSATVRQFYKLQMETKEFSIKGWNWGQYEFQGSNLHFIVGNKPAFEVPLGQVQNASVAGKNEVSLEFSHPQDGAAKPSREDELMEIRFYVPGNAKKRDGEFQVFLDDDGQAVSAAHMFAETIKDKADISALTGEPIMTFEELLCLTPRGRFEVAFYSSFFRLRGRTQDYRINYSAVRRLFLLPKPEEQQQYFFVLNLEPPIRQGQTRYPYLVFQFNGADEVEGHAPNMDAIDEYVCSGAIHQHYDAEIFKVISHVFSVVTNQKVITDKETAELLWPKYPADVSSFVSTGGRRKPGIKCTYKANEAYIYPLGPAGKCFLSLFKQPMALPFRDISSLTFKRVASGTGTAALRTFEIIVSQRGGPDVTFGNVSRDDYPALEDFAKKHGIKVRSEMTEETRVLFQDEDDEEASGG
ncbi:structure-specific recognition protein-domain-containing protein, partial [Hyaloraphidium curvatum]